MGFDYMLVHLKYTIPPAIGLTFIFRPLCTRLDIYKILFLIGVAVVATTPWDSYLNRRRVWTYPLAAFVGPTLFSITVEEVFFFIIQTYNTSILYLLLSRPILKPLYLVGTQSSHDRSLAKLRRVRFLGQAIISTCVLVGLLLIWRCAEGTCLGFLLAWAGTIAFFLWTLAYQFLGSLPYNVTLLPIVLPTIYLCFVDTLELRKGTWSIESGTKLGIYVWPGLEVEEATFFLLTNMLIVFGLVAFENAIAVLEAFPTLFPELPTIPSPTLLAQAILTDPAKYDNERIQGIREAVDRLQKKSKSFYLASSTFSGRLRIDLILLYSFCRVADDLVDEATSESCAGAWISKLSDFLNQVYATPRSSFESELERNAKFASDTIDKYPPSSQSALARLPTPFLSPKPLYDLLCGFRTDLEFPRTGCGPVGNLQTFPIKDESDLELYSSRVAGSIAELCLELIFRHSSNATKLSHQERGFLVNSGGRMGSALQYVNIARDIAKDAAIGRVYIPTSWLEEEGLNPYDVIKSPEGERIERLRTRLLGKAFVTYDKAKEAITRLPQEARAPIRVAVESYMEIGRVLSEKRYNTKAGKATVPKMRRIRVAWKALNSG